MGVLKGADFLQSKTQQCQAPHYTRWPPSLHPGLALGLPSLHSEILALPQDPGHWCPGNKCCRDALHAPGDSSQLCRIAQPSATYREIKAGWLLLSSKRQGERKTFSRGKCSIYRRAHQKSKEQEAGKHFPSVLLLGYTEGKAQSCLPQARTFLALALAR